MTDRREVGSEAMPVLAEVDTVVVICMIDNVIIRSHRYGVNVCLCGYLEIFLLVKT